MISATRSGPEGDSGRCNPTEKLAQLCDADRRTVDSELGLLAGAVMAGEPMPDPYRENDQFHGLLADARLWLETKPSANSVHAAGQRLQRAIAGVVSDVGKAKGRAA